MMKRLVINSAKTLHPPIEVEIDGVIYIVKMSKPVFAALRELEETLKNEDGKAGNYDTTLALYKEVHLMTGAPQEKIDELDARDIKEIIQYVMRAYIGPQEAERVMAKADAEAGLTEEQKEKNGLEPGANQ